jgi:hypothetical protein
MTISPLLGLGSAHLSDETFVEQFERCVYPIGAFRHADHIRLGWFYHRAYDHAEAERRMAQSIRRFASSAGAAGKFHATITIGWMKLIRSAVVSGPPAASFAEFLDANPWLLEKALLSMHYSAALLASAEARSAWIEPDLMPLPDERHQAIPHRVPIVRVAR